MNLPRRHFLVLLPAAAIAWKSVLAGTPESSPNYSMSDHWWGMLIDTPKCIGCGNCVRACQEENDVPNGNFRTWVERYHVDDIHMTSPEVISPDGGKEGFPAVAEAKDDEGKYFFVPKLCNHCACRHAPTDVATYIRRRKSRTSAPSATTASPRGSPPRVVRTARPARGNSWT